MHFLNKFKLNVEWDEVDQSELWLVDRKAQIKEKLKIVTVPLSTPRISYLKDGDGAQQAGVPPEGSPPFPAHTLQENEAIAFQVACMKRLDSSDAEPPKSKLSIEEQLHLHECFVGDGADVAKLHNFRPFQLRLRPFHCHWDWN